MAISSPEEKDAPLDPAVEQVQRRIRRLMLIAGLTLGVGMFAVFGAIVYRLTAGDKVPSVGEAVEAASASIPPGARLVSATLDGNRILLAYEHAGGTTLIAVDARSLVVTGRLELKPEGQAVPATP